MEMVKHFFASKASVLGLFTIVSTLLAIPLVVLVAQEKQTVHQYAAASLVKGAMTGTISGYVYIDSNANGERDPEEKAYPNPIIRITTKESNTYPTRDLRADSFGYFTYKFTNENKVTPFQIKLILPEGYKTSTTNPLVVPKTQKQIIEFGVIGSLAATPKPSCMPRPTCLDSVPRCLVTEPITSWCPKVTLASPKPTEMRKLQPATILPTGRK